MELTLPLLLQLVLALGLLNVWLLRASRSTAYRGGDADSLRAEFAAYGLPSWFFALVGFLKVGSALALLGGVWFPALTIPAATVVLVLMVGALAMHARVRDPLVKSLPAFAMLLMATGLCLESLPS